MAVELNAVRFENPEKPMLVILHGLLGSARNWTTPAQALSQFFNVAVLDLRNHGKSPHAETMGIEEMVEDVAYWIKQYGNGSVYLLGHSLGGKIAMALACKYPELLKGLIVEDIAPKAYGVNHDHEFNAMHEVDLKGATTRNDIEKSMEKQIQDWEHRQFLMMNLVRTDSGFNWQINLPVLSQEYPNFLKNSLNPEDRYTGRVLFLYGEQSHYASQKDEALMKEHFPNVVTIMIPNAKHNVHVDNKDDFIEAVAKFANVS